MNIGGDGKDVWPWVGTPRLSGSPVNDNVHYDISKLRQWNTVFEHTRRHGIFLHFVFNETEAANGHRSADLVADWAPTVPPPRGPSFRKR